MTGAAGFIGSHTVEKFLASSHEVVGLDNLSSGKYDNLSACFSSNAFDFVNLDLCSNFDCLNKLFKRYLPDAVVHLAALVSVRESVISPMDCYHNNVKATQNTLEACRINGIKKIVVASSASVYGDANDFPLNEDTVTRPSNPYAASKVCCESLLEAYSKTYQINGTVLRYFNVYGPRQASDSEYSGVISIFVKRLMEDRSLLVFGDGTQSRDFIHVDDVSTVNLKAILSSDSGYQVYNVCTGNECSINDLVKMIKEASGKDVLVENYTSENPGVRRSVGDNLRFAKHLGFTQRHTLEHYINSINL